MVQKGKCDEYLENTHRKKCFKKECSTVEIDEKLKDLANSLPAFNFDCAGDDRTGWSIPSEYFFSHNYKMLEIRRNQLVTIQYNHC